MCAGCFYQGVADAAATSVPFVAVAAGGAWVKVRRALGIRPDAERERTKWDHKAMLALDLGLDPVETFGEAPELADDRTAEADSPVPDTGRERLERVGLHPS